MHSDAAKMQKTFEEHQQLMQIFAKSRTKIACPDDVKSIIKTHEFVRDDEKDEANSGNWEIRMARKYYDKLYKEFALADLSRHSVGQIGMRWRTESEVVEGKGQYMCGAIGCVSADDLRSYEVPFKYKEKDESKLELVKVRVCGVCSTKLLACFSKKRSRPKSDAEEDVDIEKSGDGSAHKDDTYESSKHSKK